MNDVGEGQVRTSRSGTSRTGFWERTVKLNLKAEGELSRCQCGFPPGV